MKVVGSLKQQNVAFSDQIDPYMVNLSGEIDPTRKLQDSSDATLENFFSRPIKIYEAEWGTGTVLAFDFNPWEEYFKNPRVENRIVNFNLMRSKLHVKFVINGNGFQYGRAIAYYTPLSSFDDMSTHSALVPQDLVQGSQLPHVFLDPTTSQGGEMVLPFFWHENYASIPTTTYNLLGNMYVRSINALAHANGAVDKVTVSVFAWAEDVELSVLTSVDMGTLTPQSGDEIDQVNKMGVISGPATAVAKWAGYLVSVPTIGPFARATEMGASSVAAIAKLFGYSRPLQTKVPETLRPTPTGSLALTTTGDTAQKLTLDDKQELTIDPRIAGLSAVDPLNIREIAKRESYLTTFSWNIGVAPETLLWNARIDPVTWAESAAGGKTAFHFPACAMAALPFKYWTGTMRFRFQIVCSAFHKGRLKIVYDPNYLASNEYNTNYTTIIDIADKTDFTVEIGNGQTVTLLGHALPGLNSVTEMYSTTPYASLAGTGSNGVVGVYVVNELTTPNSVVTNDIEINVFVSMGDDFEVFVPDDHHSYFVFKPQSGDELVSEAQNTEEPSAPQQSNSEALGPTEAASSLINSVFTGEAITSFRPLLKRYNLWRCQATFFDGDSSTLYATMDMFPYLRGAVNGATETTAGDLDYNYVNTTTLHWVRYAFQGWRGSIRYKLLKRGGAATESNMVAYVQRQEPHVTWTDFTSGFHNAYSTSKSAAITVLPTKSNPGVLNAPYQGMKGSAFTISDVNPALEFEVPYYETRRFSPGKKVLLQSADLDNGGYSFYIENSGSTTNVIDIHVATGEDFQVFFFTGLPRMYYEAAPPA